MDTCDSCPCDSSVDNKHHDILWDGLGMKLVATTILITSGDVLAVIMTAIDSCYDSLLQLQR